MIDALQDLHLWDALSHDEREDIAQEVALQFHGAAVYQGLQTYAQGDQQHEMATFLLHDIPCTLLPGYHGELGYDPALHDLSYPVSPTEVAEHDERTEPTQVLVDRLLTPTRRVTLPPFLLATAAETLINREFLPDGHWQYTGVPIRRSETLAHIAEAGFRFPSSDEWEYACSGGARTFFRWGNEWPPLRLCSEEERDSEGWAEDTRPNAFGLVISQDPYDTEYCEEDDILRGGDGGAAIHAGLGYFEEWLGFATSFRWRWVARSVENKRRGHVRRAISLPNDSDVGP